MLLFLKAIFRTACSGAPSGTPGCSSSSTSIPLAEILPPVLSVFAALIAIGIFLYRRFRRTNTALLSTNTSLLNTNTNLTAKLLETETEVERYRKVWHIAEDEVSFQECIGRGAVGEVYKGKWRGIDVAIKTVKGAWMSSEEMEKELDHEASVLQNVRHANVVQFYGMGSMNDGTPFMVIELMELGTLTGVLQDKRVILDWETKTRFALETAQGMALVHSLGRIHRDLKSGNILVTMAGSVGIMRVKVADFGTATLAGIATNASDAVNAEEMAIPMTGRIKTSRTKAIGTPLWMAPEILSGCSGYGASADVYSYGIVMWEIASRQEPWVELSGNFIMDQLLVRLVRGIRPNIGEDWQIEYVKLMKECWNTDPQARPSFMAIVQRLEGSTQI